MLGIKELAIVLDGDSCSEGRVYAQLSAELLGDVLLDLESELREADDEAGLLRLSRICDRHGVDLDRLID